MNTDFLTSLIEKAGEFAATAGLRLVGTLLIVVIGFIVINRIVRALKKKASKKLDESVRNFLLSAFSIVMKVILVLTAANFLGVPMTNLVAVIGSCGLAVGLALQGSLSNFAGGLLILIFKPFRVGDYVAANGLEGTVTEITVLYTYLVTLDNKTVVIPNGALSNAAVTNYSAQKVRRVDVNVNVSYKSDVEHVKDVLSAFVSSLPYVEKEPAPAIVLTGYNESAIGFQIRAWTETAHYWDVMGEIGYGLQKALRDGGIEVAFPQLDVHLDQKDEAAK